MKKVKDSVRKVLFASEAATEAFHKRYLNFSAFAKHIRPEVEEESMKEVSVGNIVVALSRINSEENSKRRKSKHEFIPTVEFNDISVRSSLCEITFDKTERLVKKISECNIKGPQNFFYVAIGISEITMIVNSKDKPDILDIFSPVLPKTIIPDLASITVRFDSTYMSVPNTIYAIMRSIAMEFINVIEIVSTYTEISIIVERSEMTKTFEVLNKLLKS